MQLYPLLFAPNLHTVVWGGRQLRPYKGLPPTDEPIGESWEVSAVPNSISVIAGANAAVDEGLVLEQEELFAQADAVVMQLEIPVPSVIAAAVYYENLVFAYGQLFRLIAQ